jgi:DNA-binding NarL/FixJ family response regulator
MTRILIADDHDVVRAGLRTILQSQAGWEVVAEASDGKEAVELALATRPDVAVLDFGLPTLNGVEATRQIRSKLSRVEILIFTMHDTDALVRDVLEAGARFLLKSDASRFLIAAVETLADHKPFFTGKVSEALVESFLLKKPSEGALTGREKSVIQLIAEGRPNRKIAEVLSISVKSVEMNRASALKKLNADSTAALIRYAIKNRLVEGRRRPEHTALPDVIFRECSARF